MDSDPQISTVVTHGSLAAILKAFVTTAGLIKVLGGTAGVALIVGTGLSGWTVHQSNENTKAMAAMLAEHIAAEKAAAAEARAEQATKIQAVDQKVQKVYDLMIEGTVRVGRRRVDTQPATGGPGR
jgi:hypothetical protein